MADEWISDFSSSNVRAFRWDSETLELTVQFGTQPGVRVTTYVYHGVPEEVYLVWIATESKGKFHAANIRNVYPFDGPL